MWLTALETYNPYPEGKAIRERLVFKCRTMGWSIKEAANQFGVDEGTWGDWERGATILYREHREMVGRLLGVSAEEIHLEMREQWNRAHPPVSWTKERKAGC